MSDIEGIDDEAPPPAKVAPRPKGLLSRIGEVEKALDGILATLRGMWSDTHGKADLPTSDPRRRFHDQITIAGKAAGTAKAILLQQLKIAGQSNRPSTPEQRETLAKDKAFMKAEAEGRARMRGELPERRLSK